MTTTALCLSVGPAGHRPVLWPGGPSLRPGLSTINRAGAGAGEGAAPGPAAGEAPHDFQGE